MLELPWSVRDAVSLYERMDVSFNCLTEVPVELPLRLPHLEYINMSHNQLTSLPESFGLLIHLHTIIVNNNRLTSLPNSFMRLMKLKKLDVSHNALRSLPDDLGKMESLSKLNIQSNKLKTLPASLGVSPVLTVILAKDNPIKWPPSEVCKNGSDAVKLQISHCRLGLMCFRESVATSRCILQWSPLDHLWCNTCRHRPTHQILQVASRHHCCHLLMHRLMMHMFCGIKLLVSLVCTTVTLIKIFYMNLYQVYERYLEQNIRKLFIITRGKTVYVPYHSPDTLRK